jgi:hypothetical protein
MPSPFPGMNPYLEQPAAWKDFHTRFIPAAATIIGRQVRPRYFVKIEEHLYIHEPAAADRFPLGRPEVSVHTHPGTPTVGPTDGSVAVGPARVGMPAPVVEETVPFLEVIDRDNREVVAVVELLSPANKETGPNRDQYRAKMQRLLASRTAVVEIDLLRGGPRMPWDRLPACDYYAVVSRPDARAADPPQADIWPVGLRDPLPRVPVPLRPGEPEAVLDLQPLLHQLYDDADYGLYIYASPPEPRLRPDDAAWALEILAAAGITPG